MNRLRNELLGRKLDRVLCYIETHLAEKITAKDLAALTNMSVGRFFRAFKTSAGVTPLRYVTTRRVELVCTMMRTTRESLSQLALACGFSDQAHLCKVFRRTTGMSPSAWRRAMTADTRFTEGHTQHLQPPEQRLGPKVNYL